MPILIMIVLGKKCLWRSYLPSWWELVLGLWHQESSKPAAGESGPQPWRWEEPRQQWEGSPACDGWMSQRGTGREWRDYPQAPEGHLGTAARKLSPRHPQNQWLSRAPRTVPQGPPPSVEQNHWLHVTCQMKNRVSLGVCFSVCFRLFFSVSTMSSSELEIGAKVKSS